ncbi:MAG: hypothetical protein LBE64_15880 [Acinetobacter pittii]|jgi:hypothetical protein|nr:hypothetical protein [Acinetobacter pittii]
MFGEDTYEEVSRQEFGERLLAEEGTLCDGKGISTRTCNSFAVLLLQLSALMLLFLVVALFGFHWRGDMDGLCSRHVSQSMNNDYVVRRHMCIFSSFPSGGMSLS